MRNSVKSSQPSRPLVCRWLAVGAASFVYLLPVLPLEAALDIHLKLGEIMGDSQDPGHEGEIDLISWGWGGSRASIRRGIPGRFNVPPKDVNAFVFTKRTDSSTPAILNEFLSGRHLHRATLSLTDSGSGRPLEILKIELEDVLVTSYDMAGDESDAVSLDTFALQFNAIRTRYSANQENSEFFWDVNTKTGEGASGGGFLPNRAPTISAITDQSIAEDGSIEVTFTVSDWETPLGALRIEATSSNSTLLPLSRIVLRGSSSTRTATLSPFFDEHGSSTIRISVSDGSKSDSSTFTLTVSPVNDPPSLEQLGDQVTEANVPLNASVTVIDIDSNIDDVTLTATANPPADVTSIADTTGSGNIRNLRIVPAPSTVSRDIVITMTADDHAAPPGQNTTQTSFTLTVNPATGGGPTAVLLDGLRSTHPVQVDENSPNGIDLGLFEAVDGPGIEHEFLLIDDAGGRFTIGALGNPRLFVANGALLNFEEASSHTILVQARDLFEPERVRTESFRIELQNVNEPPAITLPPGFGTTPPDADTSLEGIRIEDPDSGPEDILVTFTVLDGILIIDESGALAGKTVGNYTSSLSVIAPIADLGAVLASPYGLIYRSDPSFTGTETLTVTTDDGGNTGPPGPLGDTASSTLEVELTRWELWRRANFTAAELLDPGMSSFSADPDRDGLANGGEYGVGSLPKDQSSGPGLIQLVYVESDGEFFPALRFPRRVSDPGLFIEVELAVNLLDWMSGPAFTIEEALTPIDADFEEPIIRSFFPVSVNPEQHIRLRFRLATP